MDSILIVGCGYVGGALAELLAQDGRLVWGTRRTITHSLVGVRMFEADVLLPESLREIPKEIEYAVYCVSADGRTEISYRNAYVIGLGNTLEALRARCPKLRRVLFTSSTGVYGQNRGEWVDEHSPAQPSGFTGEAVLEGERLLSESDIESVNVRFSGIYGPGRDRLIQLVKSGYRLTPQDAAFTNRIHRDDCASVLKHLLFVDNTEEVYIGSDCEPASREAIMLWLAKQMSVDIRQTDRDEGLNGIPMNKRLSNRRLLDSGYRFMYPTFREGFASLL